MSGLYKNAIAAQEREERFAGEHETARKVLEDMPALTAETIEQRALLAGILRLLREEEAEERESARWIDTPGDA